MAKVNSSIKLGSGFLLKNAPVDLKTTAATITERDSYVTDGILYKGALVYVEENDTRYRYTGAQPSGSDFSSCWVVDTVAGDASQVTQEAIDAAIQEQVTDKIGDTIQAHSAVLDEVAKLDTEGLAYRKADGTFTEMTISGQNGIQVTVTPDSGTISAELTSVGTAGTYTKVTTDAQGRVTAGENPTTLAGYGITDAVNVAGGTMTGPLKYDTSVTEDRFDDNTLIPKYYADSVALGYVPHTACETGSAENVDGVYADGTSVPESPGVGATFTLSANTGNTTALSGVTLTTGMRVLLVAQTDAKQNGAYVVTEVPEAATGNVVMQRVEDFDGEPHVSYDGASFLISDGNLKGTVWALQNKGAITFGTDNINFVQSFAPTQYIAGDGVSISANMISVKQGSTVAVIGGNLEVASGNGNQGKILIAQGNGQAAAWGDASFDNINGTVPVTKGGTGAETLPANQLLIGNGTNAVQAVTNAEGVLIGTASGAPTFGQVDLTKHVTGALPVANGGTGATDAEGAFAAIAPAGATKGDLMYYDGTKWVALAKGAANTILGVDSDGELTFLTSISQGTF